MHAGLLNILVAVPKFVTKIALASSLGLSADYIMQQKFPGRAVKSRAAKLEHQAMVGAPVPGSKPNVVKHRNPRLPIPRENLFAHRARTKQPAKKWPSNPSPAYVLSPGPRRPNSRQLPLPRPAARGGSCAREANELLDFRCSAGASSLILELRSVSSPRYFAPTGLRLGYNLGGVAG